MVAEAQNSTAVTSNYVWGPDRVLVKKVVGGSDYYYLYNGHGDVVQMVDRNGNVVNNYQYDEWGNIEESNETVSNPFKYAGEVYDQETGLYYLRARYYDPIMGRFINQDSFEGQIYSPLTLNLYTYCVNNPMSYVDPSGHIIRLAGTKEQQNVILESLQTLTDYTLSISDDDTVIIEYSTSDNYVSGNELIKRMIYSDQTCTIQIAEGVGNTCSYTDIENGTNGIGADSIVTYNPDADPSIKTVDPSSGNVSPAKRPNYIRLAHELIHADRAQRGVTIDLSKRGSYKYQTDVVYVKGFWYFSSSWDITYSTETVRREELATVGLKYNSIWDDITENGIRSEHGLNLRGAY